ncbi:MAG: Zn-dependent M16 (insulinase) family peptidase, partial [Halioglobus sp.]
MNMPASHPAFTHVRSEHIQSLNIDVHEYLHSATGTPHVHLATDNPENVFMVGLRTVPTDSTGVAHILEHTVLCGSEKYPVRDPFFMMIRRSLNTFMNAFTSSDWTAYPFASQNRKDYFNLLDVYLDAVFFSRLHELDFAQEGHRVEFEKADDPETDLVFKGIVFNEMKGAMSAPTSMLWQSLSKYLYPNSTYHFNSGGEPEDIPDLSYEQLKSFYDTHYHPSNAVFMTYGDIAPDVLQTRFEEQVLNRFEKLDRTIQVEPAKRYHSPMRVQESYATQEEDTADKTHIVVSWLLGESINLDDRLRSHLLSSVLLDNSASPLMRALEQSDLGNSPSPLCGLEDSNREMVFACGLEGSNPDQTLAVEKLVLDVLESVARDGVPQEQVDAVLHQLELSQREIRGDGMPFGLQLVLSGLSTAMQRGDTLAAIDLDPALERLRLTSLEPGFISNLVKELLLDNPHRVTMTMAPDRAISERRNVAEKQRLAKMKAALSDTDKTRIV